jgi:hypothetical protein
MNNLPVALLLNYSIFPNPIDLWGNMILLKKEQGRKPFLHKGAVLNNIFGSDKMKRIKFSRRNSSL